jgi:hypothetical protein
MTFLSVFIQSDFWVGLHMPSYSELELINSNLYLVNMKLSQINGAQQINGIYWSSTGYSFYGACAHIFWLGGTSFSLNLADGAINATSVYTGGTFYYLNARAIRKF